ncbi:hypothetical protein Vadar_006416 [Vaccinium darrowii]|uniref:Uncharacterized protein n=1 Tax=Vaccinium darrowii TaxID=229202 RepID=A0ACB7X8I2_9ERIC|nr:hypothetical protein Vadar_006416 [Vaccinium darrowii]
MRRGSKDETAGDKPRHQSRTKSANRDDETVIRNCGLGWIKQRTWCRKQRKGSRGVEMPEGGALVPEFGKWDVKNPESEDFTGKFKRVQEDKHNGPGKSPVELGTPTSSFTTQGNQNTDDSAKVCMSNNLLSFFSFFLQQA